MIAALDLTHHAASVAARADDERFHVPGWLWAAFIAGVVVMLLVDLLVLNREAHEISVREAAITSAVWIAIGLSFSLVLWGVLDNGGTLVAYLGDGFQPGLEDAIDSLPPSVRRIELIDGVDVLAIPMHLPQRRTCEQPSLGPRMTGAQGLVVRVE